MRDTDIKSAIKLLIDEKYLIVIEGDLVITSKMRNSLGLSRVKRSVEDTAKSFWYKFITDAKVPHRIDGGDGRTYTVRQFNKKIATYLFSLVVEQGIDYDTLVLSTKLYYQSNGYRAILTNYFEREIWKSEYERLLDGDRVASGTNRFED